MLPVLPVLGKINSSMPAVAHLNLAPCVSFSLSALLKKTQKSNECFDGNYLFFCILFLNHSDFCSLYDLFYLYFSRLPYGLLSFRHGSKVVLKFEFDCDFSSI